MVVTPNLENIQSSWHPPANFSYSREIEFAQIPWSSSRRMLHWWRQGLFFHLLCSPFRT